MEIILIAVTLLSLIVAVVMSVIAGRLIRDDRRRSAARLEALSAEADFEERRTVAADRQHARVLPAVADQPPPIRERATPVVLSQEPGQVSGAMFGAVQRARPRMARPLAIAAACGVVAVVAAVTFFTSSSAEGPVTASHQVSNATDASLELLSLTHARTDTEWTIAGTVRNVDPSSEIGGVTVLAFLFDAAGSSVGSGHAPLELAKLGAGETSPFSVSVAPTGRVARYRIGFRGETGQVIRHFDRRPTPPQQARQ